MKITASTESIFEILIISIEKNQDILTTEDNATFFADCYKLKNVIILCE